MPNAKKTINKLDPQIQTRIAKFLRRVIQHPMGPRDQAEALQGPFSGLYRYRVGDYRLVCEFHDHVLTIWVMDVGHRSEIYH